MKKSSKTLFFSMMIISTLIVLSSTSWIHMWMGLEVNLMSFIPMISAPKNPFLAQGTMGYFLVQSMSSMMFIIFILMSKYIFIILEDKYMNIMIMMIMMMKMGMPPFHMWFTEIMSKMSWILCFLLMTWQKVAPMYIISMMTKMSSITTMIICLSAMVGALGGLNQTSMKKIMAYSSMNHMSWMVVCALMYKKSWIMYMIMYSLMMLVLTLTLEEYNITYINQMNIFLKNTMEKIILTMTMLSIGGLPPFLGFLPKWITIQYMISSKEFLMMSIMVMMSLITMSYYIRVTSSLNLMMSYSQKWMLMLKSNSKMFMNLLTINFMLPMMLLMINFY